MFLNSSETVVKWICYHTDSMSSRIFNFKIYSNVSVNGRLRGSTCGNHLLGGKWVDSNARCSCQPDYPRVVYYTQRLLKDRKIPSSFLQLQHQAQDLESSGCLINVDLKNEINVDLKMNK